MLPVRNPRYLISEQLLIALKPASPVLALDQHHFARRFRMVSSRGGGVFLRLFLNGSCLKLLRNIGILEVDRGRLWATA